MPSRIRFIDSCRLVACAIAALSASHAAAVVDTVPQPCGDKVCLWDKPRIDAPAGWTLDETTSRATRVSMFVPGDRGIGGAPVVFYARAFKHESGDLGAFVAADLDRMLAKQLTLSVSNLPDLKGDGKSRFIRRRVATSAADGTHETIAYIEDGEYFVTFVLSARTAADHDRARLVFERWLQGYRPAAAA